MNCRSLQPYTVPQEVAAHIDFIGGINHFPSTSPSLLTSLRCASEPYRCACTGVQRLARRSLAVRGSGSVDPNVIKRVFNVSSVVGKSSANSQARPPFS
jgi:hypothetical protein